MPQKMSSLQDPLKLPMFSSKIIIYSSLLTCSSIFGYIHSDDMEIMDEEMALSDPDVEFTGQV